AEVMRAGQGKMGRTLGAVALVALLAACSKSGEPQLMNLSSGRGPDEFAILPTKALEAPPDYRSLPAPTPGGSNRTDPTPEADAIAALGGRASAKGTAGEAALLAYAGRMGTDPSIRATLAADDLEWRR